MLKASLTNTSHRLRSEFPGCREPTDLHASVTPMFRTGVGGGHGFFVHDFLAPTGLTDYAVTCFSQIRSSTKCSKRDIVWSEGNGRQMKMK